jgi:hydroxymethylbilane synthase
MIKQPLRIGTRASKLALAQAGQTRAKIAAALGDDAAAVLVHITTSGDRIQDRRLMDIGGKGLFTKEIEEALLDGRVDCAIHSLKDMPADGPEGLTIAAIPEREDPRDAFLSVKYATFDALPHGGRLGTASLRRQAQALRARPDLQVESLRGNIDTRMAKLENGDFDAIFLAAAGLNRLGLAAATRSWLDPVVAPPAPGQGALAIQTRTADADAAWLVPLRHRDTLLAVAAERGALTALEASCKTAVGAYAVVADGEVRLIVEALTPDGTQSFRETGATSADGADAESRARTLGLDLGGIIRARGGAALMIGA